MSLSWATHASNCAESWVKESSSKELESDAGPSYYRKKKPRYKYYTQQWIENSCCWYMNYIITLLKENTVITKLKQIIKILERKRNLKNDIALFIKQIR